MNDLEKQEIAKQAKKVMDDFAQKLSKIDVEEQFLENGFGVRLEESGWETDESFRDFLFKNAPEKNSSFIIAERGKWK